MTSYALKEHWRGASAQAIGESMQITESAEEVEKTIEAASKKLRAEIIDGIIKRAQGGDLAAVEWLEARGFIPKIGTAVNPLTSPA